MVIYGPEAKPRVALDRQVNAVDQLIRSFRAASQPRRDDHSLFGNRQLLEHHQNSKWSTTLDRCFCFIRWLATNHDQQVGTGPASAGVRRLADTGSLARRSARQLFPR